MTKLSTEIPEEYEGPPPSLTIDIVRTSSNGSEHRATCTEDGLAYWEARGYRRVEDLESGTD